jgi:hypothetical protein
LSFTFTLALTFTGGGFGLPQSFAEGFEGFALGLTCGLGVASFEAFGCGFLSAGCLSKRFLDTCFCCGCADLFRLLAQF